jgi:hypothetical protein
VALEIETGRNPDYPAQITQMKQVQTTAGLGFGLQANLAWFGREQSKVLAFDEGVFIFMLSAALIIDQLTPMLWVFASSQVFWGLYKSWLRGKNIDENLKVPTQK